mmetsp:Transcript_27814/g.57421  ORF Transcript_27814/g.57421 Transcript_27814/m.57421 type:complete len:289 (-) Transcript_27814:804-1670(-)
MIHRNDCFDAVLNIAKQLDSRQVLPASAQNNCDLGLLHPFQGFPTLCNSLRVQFRFLANGASHQSHALPPAFPDHFQHSLLVKAQVCLVGNGHQAFHWHLQFFCRHFCHLWVVLHHSNGKIHVSTQVLVHKLPRITVLTYSLQRNVPEGFQHLRDHLQGGTILLHGLHSHQNILFQGAGSPQYGTAMLLHSRGHHIPITTQLLRQVLQQGTIQLQHLEHQRTVPFQRSAGKSKSFGRVLGRLCHYVQICSQLWNSKTQGHAILPHCTAHHLWITVKFVIHITKSITIP